MLQHPNLPSYHAHAQECPDFVEFRALEFEDEGFQLSKHKQIFLNHVQKSESEIFQTPSLSGLDSSPKPLIQFVFSWEVDMILLFPCTDTMEINQSFL